MLLPGNDSLVRAEVPGTNRSAAPGSGGAPDGGGSGSEAVIVPVVFGLIFVVGVVGNSLVMVVIGGVRHSGAGEGGRRSASPTNIFILNLSVADLGFLMFCVPFQATIYSLPEWVFGAFLCSFGHYFTNVSMLVSIFTLVAMSVDRYVAVVRSNKAPCVRSRKNALVGVCIIWMLSLLCSVPVAQHQVLTSHHTAPNSTFCWEHWSGASRRSYKVTILLLGYLLPLLLISCCYAKTAQTVFLVITAFTICWMPYHIIAMWVEFGTFPLNNTSFAFRIVAHCLSYGNSCINPILYAFLSENFRKACRQIFTCCFLYPPPPQNKVVCFRMENFSTMHSTTTYDPDFPRSGG